MNKPILKNILFLDIETVSEYKDFESLNPKLQKHWINKSLRFKHEKTDQEFYFDRAAIFAEFGKIVCVSVGAISETAQILKLKAIANHNEKSLLQEFIALIENHKSGQNLILCAHNGKEFDFPYLCRRMLINGLQIPTILNISFKKPWEIPHLDTLEMWKFGDYKHYTSLDLLASLFGIEGSKSAMDGSQVNHVYYIEQDLDKIAKYCKEDVMILAQLYLRLNNLPLIQKSNINL